MKKIYFNILLLFFCMFICFGCSCSNAQTISKEEAIEILKKAKIEDNVEIITTTETIINGIKSTSTQKDVYHSNKYYHLSENNGVSTKTWYGEVNDVLYAFYYTKNSKSEERKISSRIDVSQLDSAKKQPSIIIDNLFNNQGNLISNYTITANKNNNTYIIQISGKLEEEKDTFLITIKDNKIIKIVKSSRLENDTIKTTYNYNYDIEDFTLPALNEYHLIVNG